MNHQALLPRVAAAVIVLLGIELIDLALAAVVFARFASGERATNLILAGIGVLVAGVAATAWVARHDARAHGSGAGVGDRARWVRAGLALGLLWTAEIGVNNIVQPPLPGRDIFDDVIWAIVTVAILVVAGHETWVSRRLRDGVVSGAWLGATSGAVACTTALGFVALGTSFLASDPLALAEWAVRGPASGAPSLEAYVALDTYAGGLGHLVLIGAIMGTLTGLLAGVVARAAGAVRGRG